MSDQGNRVWYHNNRYNAQSACQTCGGIVRHETWCAIRNAFVRYAWEIVYDPERLTTEDALLLHCLGVRW